jgi:succinate dehydrogenase/fumarate reductase flavoprotein subunit
MTSVICDVLVIGSGAGGMAAALTAHHSGLDVLLVEKEPLFGGTTCFSAGVIWIPANTKGKEAGIEDSEALGLEYLRQEAGNRLDEQQARAYLATAPVMLNFFEANTHVRFDLLPAMPDYHPRYKGGLGGGRSLRPQVYDGKLLGPWFEKLRPPLRTMTIFGGMMVGSGDVIHLYNVTRSPKSTWHAAKMLLRHALDRLGYARGTRLTNGNALIARLAHSLLDRNIPLWLSSPARELIVEDGRVAGAIVHRKGEAVTVMAQRGVILATGGFPANGEMRSIFDEKIKAAPFHHSLPPAGNRGDGIKLAESVGGARDTNVHHHVAWVPVSAVPQPDGSLVGFPHFNDRAKPGVIVVDRRGRRFADEAIPYHDFVPAMLEVCRQDDAIEAFMICDHKSIRRYGMGAVPPAPLSIASFVKSGYLKRADTLRELAVTLGISPEGLAETISAYNPFARKGEDPAFGRGADAFEKAHGGPHDRGQHPNIAPIEAPPFYALKIIPGDIATFVGLKTDVHARVLDQAGNVITGLYAVGNDMTNVVRGTYPGAGITLGPAMTFGYIAGLHLAAEGPSAAAL